MNKAIFLFTLFFRFTQLSQALSLVMFAFVLPLGLAFSSTNVQIGHVIETLLMGPLISLILAYYLVKDGVANQKGSAQGEYLALLFTRPLSRTDYLISKWLAGAIGVMLVRLVEIVVYHLAQKGLGHTAGDLGSLPILANVVLNSFSFTALVVLVASVPMRLGVWLLLLLNYAALFGGSLADFSLRDAGGTNAFFAAFAWLMQSIKTFLFPSINVFDLLNTVQFSWQPIVSYFLNISLCLLLASAILNRREFFYAND